jgi:hypothetical protein
MTNSSNITEPASNYVLAGVPVRRKRDWKTSLYAAAGAI